jgi:hypothetical protein
MFLQPFLVGRSRAGRRNKMEIAQKSRANSHRSDRAPAQAQSDKNKNAYLDTRVVVSW